MLTLGKIASLLLAVANVWLAVATSSELMKREFFQNGIPAHFAEKWAQYYFFTVAVALFIALLSIRKRRAMRDEFLRHILDLAVEQDLSPGGIYDDRECKATIYEYVPFSLVATFQCKAGWNEWNWPWSGWLIPVVRSGNAGLPRFRKTVYRASVRSGAAPKYHGVTGAIWAMGNYQFLATKAPPDGRRLRKYEKDVAAKMCLTVAQYELRRSSGRTLSEYIYGQRIELAGGRRWGVLVFDSPPPDEERRATITKSDKLVVGVLSRALEWGVV